MKAIKKNFYTLALALPMAGIMITSCQSSNTDTDKAREKLQNAEEQVVEANQALNQTLNDSIQLFKTENGEIIVSYDQRIAELKTKLADVKEENKIDMEKHLAMLEQKSVDMKMKLKDYQEDGEENWRSFKNEFNHDMKELGKAFEDLTTNNVI
jgi:phage-related minor tail protein